MHKARRNRPEVEWVIAVSVLMLLAVALWPALIAPRRNAQAMQAGTQLHGLAQALASYAADNRNAYPQRGSDVASILAQVVSAELDEWLEEAAGGDPPRVLYCPPSHLGPRARDVLLLENPAIDPDGINVVYGDLHLEYVPKEAMPALLGSIGDMQSLRGTPVMLPTEMRGIQGRTR